MSLREQKKQRLIQEIVDATVDLIEQVGYEATQVEQITQRVRISKPTFYRYFASKDEVLAEVQIRWNESWAQALEQSLLESHAESSTESPPSTLEQLGQLAHLAAADLLANEELSRALYIHGSSVPTDRVRRAERQAEHGLARLMEAGQRNGDVNPNVEPALLSLIVDSIFLSVSYAWAIGEISSASLEDCLRRAIEACFHGLGH